MKKSILLIALLAAGTVLFAEGAQDTVEQEATGRVENAMTRMRSEPMAENEATPRMRAERTAEPRELARNRGPVHKEVFDEAPEITVEGELVLEYGKYLLDTGSAEYHLMVPGMRLLDLEVEAGVTVSVSGKLADAELLPDFVGSGDGVILVESGEIDGETYEVDTDFMEGFRAGRMSAINGQDQEGGERTNHPQNNRGRR